MKYSSSSRAPDRLELLLSLLILHNLGRAISSPATGFLLGKKQSELDGWIFLSGLASLLTKPDVLAAVNILGQLSSIGGGSGAGSMGQVSKET